MMGTSENYNNDYICGHKGVALIAESALFWAS